MSAFIPSPAHGILHLGPIELHAYGLMLAIAVLVAAKIASVRWRQSGNNPKDIADIAVPVVIAGVIGARVYHLFTGYKWDQDGIARHRRDLARRPVDLGRGRRRRADRSCTSRTAGTSTRSR